MDISFTKYQGLGNDFILIDNRDRTEPLLTPDRAVHWCDRNFGIGADGVIFLLPEETNKDSYMMRIYNSDGSEPEMCGNGIRCLAKFMIDLGIEPVDHRYEIHTNAGLISIELNPDGQLTVDMGEPILVAEEIPTKLVAPKDKAIAVPLQVDGEDWQVTAVSMGNPHCITFVDDVTTISLNELGPKFEYHSAFPQRTNAEFIQVVSPDRIKMLVWERGAGATLACGTGACAAVVAGVLNGKFDRNCTVNLPGGDLRIHWSAENNHVFMTGPAEKVFTGVLSGETAC